MANLLRNAGHEVIVLGNTQPEAIAKAARDENVDCIGISAYCGGEVEQSHRMVKALDGFEPALMIGGILSPESQEALEWGGFKCFTSGDPADILAYLGR